MAISRQEKQALVKEYEENLDSSRAFFLAHYTGLTVGEMERVREAMAREETRVEVLRNRLFLIAAQRAGKEAVGQILDGPTLAVFCLGDPTSPAKTLSGFARDMEGLSVYGGLLGQAVLGAEEFQQLAGLPSREELLAKVVGGLQAPIYGLVSVLGGVLRSMLYVLQARIDQLEGQAS
ncbi:MAG: 50S ribosomal protein L10 [Anaerolineae bacterium]|nr:50S ribosomal protein L10 [Anaerolineae bacterium]